MNTLIAIIGLGVLCLLFEIFNLRKGIIPITVIGLLAVLGLDISEFNSPDSYYNNMIAVSKFSSDFSALFIILTIFLVTLSHKFYENHTGNSAERDRSLISTTSKLPMAP